MVAVKNIDRSPTGPDTHPTGAPTAVKPVSPTDPPTGLDRGPTGPDRPDRLDSQGSSVKVVHSSKSGSHISQLVFELSERDLSFRLTTSTPGMVTGIKNRVRNDVSGPYQKYVT